MAKQKSVFNSSKKGIDNNALPPRPWAQQAENEPSMVLDEESKSLKTTKNINVEEILYTEKPFASVLLEGNQKAYLSIPA